MKDILIKSEKECSFLRTEAVAKAVEYEEHLLNNRTMGNKNPVLWLKTGTSTAYRFEVYHTRTAIVVEIKIQKKPFKFLI